MILIPIHETFKCLYKVFFFYQNIYFHYLLFASCVMQSEDITKVDERHKKSCDHESLLFVYIDKSSCSKKVQTI